MILGVGCGKETQAVSSCIVIATHRIPGLSDEVMASAKSKIDKAVESHLSEDLFLAQAQSENRANGPIPGGRGVGCILDTLATTP
jgi:hypothetical protein